LKSPHLPKTCLWKFSNKTHRWGEQQQCITERRRSRRRRRRR
jgi:hypothetical protein